MSIAVGIPLRHARRMKLVNRLPEWRKRAEHTQESLTAECRNFLGPNHARWPDFSKRTIQRWEKKEHLSPEAIDLLTDVLQITPEDLTLPPRDPGDAWAMHRRNGSIVTPLPPSGPAPTIPVAGTARAALAGSLDIDRVQPIDHVVRPPALLHARDAYAIRIIGNSMSPAHEDGDLRFVDPNRPVRPGDTVLIQSRSGGGGRAVWYIKRLVRRTDDAIVTEQLTPPAEIRFVTRHVVAVHKILTTAELFGV